MSAAKISTLAVTVFFCGTELCPGQITGVSHQTTFVTNTLVPPPTAPQVATSTVTVTETSTVYAEEQAFASLFNTWVNSFVATAGAVGGGLYLFRRWGAFSKTIVDVRNGNATEEQKRALIQAINDDPVMMMELVDLIKAEEKINSKHKKKAGNLRSIVAEANASESESCSSGSAWSDSAGPSGPGIELPDRSRDKGKGKADSAGDGSGWRQLNQYKGWAQWWSASKGKVDPGRGFAKWDESIGGWKKTSKSPLKR